jgi:dihydropyrimidinase
MKTALIKNGQIVTSSQRYFADVFIVDGRIAAVGQLSDLVTDHVIDASGCYVMPGGVDPHTHMDTPVAGTTTSDNFETGTMAAAVGGTTTIIDFPIQSKGQDPRDAVVQWHLKAQGVSTIDWAFHQIITEVTDETLPALDELVGDGITSFKLFTAYPGSWMLDDGAIFKVLRNAADNGSFIMFHCENGLAIDVLVKEAIAHGDIAPIFHAKTRPSTAEGEATGRVLALAAMANVPLYIVHLSAKEALEAVREARDRNVRVYAETCPHYLLLSERNLEEGEFEGAKYVCSPPLRTADHAEALWEGLATGDLQVVSTDHAAFCFHTQKKMGITDFSKIPNGMPGVEWRIGLLHHYGVCAGRFDLNRLVDLTSTTPAKLFGIYPQKGEIAPGSDADIVIFDPAREHLLTAADQVTDNDYNPYEGRKIVGWPRVVLLRGEVIVADGKFIGKAGQGVFVRSGLSSALS